MPGEAPLAAFAVAPPGFADLVAVELVALGLGGVRAVEGGAEFADGWPAVWRANLWSRVASRVLVRVACFEADTFSRLEVGLARVEWARWLPPGCPLEIRVAKRQTRLFHTGKVAEVTRGALARGAGAREPAPGEAPLRLQVRVDGPGVTVSLDTSGEHLHRRGYRARTGAAPLRENLAAGLLLRAGYGGAEPLLDPLCGSGTLAVEAALLALGRAPGRRRRFAFEALPGFDPRAWAAEQAAADSAARRDLPAPVFASDRDPGAVALAAAAGRAAGLAEHLQVAVAELGELMAPAEGGLLVANPPYGVRLPGGAEALRALGRAVRGPFRGWRWAVVTGRGGGRGLGGTSRFPFQNGGIALDLVQGGAR